MDGLKSPEKSFDISKMEVWQAWEKVKSNKGAPGVDGRSVKDFEKDLNNNLYRIWNRMSSGSYFPPPVRAVDIPKAHGGGTRRLGVPTVADRIAQTVVARRLEAKVEPIFHHIGSTTTLTASSDRHTYRTSSPVTLTAVVALLTDDPAAGQVEFLEGDQVLATKPVKDDTATYTLSSTVVVGSHDSTARFVPSKTTVTGSTTPAPVRVEVVAIGSTTTLATSRDGQIYGSPQPLALAAKVTLADHSPAGGS